MSCAQTTGTKRSHGLKRPPDRTSPYADLVETNEDARYFEFGRSRPGDPQFYLRARVFKCAYLDRSSADLRAATGPAGRLNQRPLTAAELQTLSEYLWQFTQYNNFGHIVLKSSGDATSAGLSHTLHLASLSRGGVSAACDRISVIAWRHDLDAATGAVELNVETLWTFGARENAGVSGAVLRVGTKDGLRQEGRWQEGCGRSRKAFGRTEVAGAPDIWLAGGPPAWAFLPIGLLAAAFLSCERPSRGARQTSRSLNVSWSAFMRNLMNGPCAV